MGSRGRKSAAALGVIHGIPQRPEPPDELTPEQAEEWREIVGRMPVDWFGRQDPQADLAQPVDPGAADRGIAMRNGPAEVPPSRSPMSCGCRSPVSVDAEQIGERVCN
jgi:hypothetical protein